MLYHSLAGDEHSRHHLEFMLLQMAAPLPVLLLMLLCQGSFLLFLPLHYELLKGDKAKSHLLSTSGFQVQAYPSVRHYGSNVTPS